MANWCYSSYCIEGDNEEVRSLYRRMKRLQDRRKSLVENDFGKTWLGNLVTDLGSDWKEVYCRGTWSDLGYEKGILRFNTETAYSPMNAVMKLAKSKYPSLRIYYSAEEDGWGMYVTNDAEGKHYPDRYFVESEWGREYFSTMTNVCVYVSGLIKKEVRDEKELRAAIEEWNENVEDIDENITLNEFKVEKDEYLRV